jgi:selenide,water dikinase
VHFDTVPVLEPAVIHQYLDKGSVPGGTNRNFSSYGHLISPLSGRQKEILCDPQTSGGLLVAIDQEETREFEDLMVKEGYVVHAFGQMKAAGKHVIVVSE